MGLVAAAACLSLGCSSTSRTAQPAPIIAPEAPAAPQASGGAVAPLPATSGPITVPAAAAGMLSPAPATIAGAQAPAATAAGQPASAGASGVGGGAGAPLAAAAGSASSTTSALPGCPKVSLKVGDQSFNIASKNGQKYSYILSVPKTVTPTQRAPLIVHWHALGSDPEEARRVTSIDAKAEAAGALIVYPRSPDKSWDVGSCCSAVVGGEPRDEAVFARELIKDVLGKACVDEKRIYTNGFSNGGMVSQMLACKMGDVFAAAAPIGSTLTIDQADCKPSRPVPLLMINGTADPLVGYSSPSLAGGLPFISDTSFWAKLNGCTGTPEMFVQQGKATCQRYLQCKRGAEVAFCSVEGMGHCVPGMRKESDTNCLTTSGIVLGMPNDDIDALQMSVDFLFRFSLP